MGVRFVVGRAGSGKTRRCFEAIVEELRGDALGRPIYWILPRQATFMAERELTCASGLAGFCRARVLSFDQLGNDVLEECGGAAVAEVTRLGRQMILGRLLRKHEEELKFFSKVARHAGLAVTLEQTLAEFDRCGRDPAQLEDVVKELEKDSEIDQTDATRAKLHDLALIYRAYTAYLGQERLDPRRRMQRVLECMASSKRFAGAKVYVDAFADFDEFQRKLIAGLARVCAEVEITLLMDPQSAILGAADEGALAELSVFHRSERAYVKLRKVLGDEGIAVGEPVRLGRVRRFEKAAALARIEAGMFETTKGGDRPGGAVEWVEAPDGRAEADHAARRVKELAASGIRYREIAVLVRDLEEYHDVIRAAFAEHGVPYFADKRRGMGHHPLVQLVRGCVGVAQGSWSSAAVMGMVKSGLAGLSGDEADRLENYVMEHRIRGTTWTRKEAWSFHRPARDVHDDGSVAGADESAAMDVLRRGLAERVGPFVVAMRAKALSVRGIAGELFALLGRMKAGETLAGWITAAREAKEYEQAGEHEQVWSKLVDLIDELVDVLGDEPVELEEFEEILEAGLETFDLALAPPMVDQVLVGQVDRTRTAGDLKAALVLGLNEGVFPRAARQVSVLSDGERTALRRHAFEVEDGSERRQLDERLLGYQAFTRASELLYVSRVTADGKGRALAASPFLHRLEELVEPARVVLPQDARTRAEMIGTPRQLFSALMHWARTEGGAGGGDVSAGVETGAAGAGVWPALYDWVARHPANDDAIDALRYRVWRALSYTNEAFISKATAAGLFASPMRVGVSQIESFARCPFQHFVRYALRLRPRDEAEEVELELEDAFHRTLESMVRTMLSQRKDWASLSEAQCEAAVKRYAAQLATTLRGELMLSNARNRYLLDRLEETIGQVIATARRAGEYGSFKAGYTKVEFGSGTGSAVPALSVMTQSGGELRIEGRIDRVDLLEKQAAFAVMDYRLFGKTLDLSEVYHGLSLQLMTYLLVLREHGDKLAGRKMRPAAAFFVKLLRQMDSVEHPDDAPAPGTEEFDLRVKPRGIFSEEFFKALDHKTQTGPSKVVKTSINRDGTHGYRNSSDVASAAELDALLDRVKRTIGELGEKLMAGDVGISPYRIGTTTPCSHCDYHSVCRFDATINHYHFLPKLKRDEVLKVVGEGGADGQ